MNSQQRRCVRCVVAALLAWAFLRLPADGATPAAYDQALAQVQAALSRQAQALQVGTTIPAAQSPATVAARVLTPITGIERPGQPAAPVNSSLLLAAVRTAGTEGDKKSRAAALQTAAMQIADLRRDIRATDAPTGAGDSRAETSLRAVLSRPAFGYDPLPPPSLFDRFTEWLDRMLRRLFHRRPHPDPTLPNVSLGFVKGIVIVLGVAAFAVLVGGLVQWLRRRPARTQPLALDETEAALVEARDTDSLRALAEQKAGQGDYRPALRFVYLALLVSLDTQGVLRFDHSKTNWEYLRALRAAGRADVYDVLAPLTRDFDRVWYGFARADADDYARALAQFDALQSASDAPPNVGPPVAA